MKRIKTNTRLAVNDVIRNLLFSVFISLVFFGVLFMILKIDSSFLDYLGNVEVLENKYEDICFMEGQPYIERYKYDSFLSNYIDRKKLAMSTITNIDTNNPNDWILLVASPDYLDRINFSYNKLSGNRKIKSTYFKSKKVELKLILNNKASDKYGIDSFSKDLDRQFLEKGSDFAQRLIFNNYEIIGTHNGKEKLFNARGAIDLKNTNIALVTYEEFLKLNFGYDTNFYGNLQFMDFDKKEISNFCNILNRESDLGNIRPMLWSEINENAVDSIFSGIEIMTFILLFILLFYLVFITIVRNIISRNMREYAIHMLTGGSRKDIIWRLGFYFVLILIIPTLVVSLMYFIVYQAQADGSLVTQVNLHPYLPICIFIFTLVLLLTLAARRLTSDEIISHLYTE